MKSEHSTISRRFAKLLFSEAKKYTILSFILFAGMMLTGMPLMACEACKQQQPKFLQGITHGPGPDSNWDYLIVSFMVFITLYSLYATVKCMIRPSEKENEHIKRMILNQ